MFISTNPLFPSHKTEFYLSWYPPHAIEKHIATQLFYYKLFSLGSSLLELALHSALSSKITNLTRAWTGHSWRLLNKIENFLPSYLRLPFNISYYRSLFPPIPTALQEPQFAQQLLNISHNASANYFLSRSKNLSCYSHILLYNSN